MVVSGGEGAVSLKEKTRIGALDGDVGSMGGKMRRLSG